MSTVQQYLKAINAIRKCEKIQKSAATNYCIATERSAEI
jgi:hypothetical protein